ncbi:MAG: hypothetical protein HKP51_00365 [Sulfitobacter sp.]|nr:hypothetical protein [Sulfitobacter sp.]
MGWLTTIRAKTRQTLDQIRNRVPFGLRSVLGVLLIGGGMLGFLPILGFWMIPLGIAVIAIDLGQIWKAIRRHR